MLQLNYLQSRKANLKRDLVQLEKQIFAMEGSYLAETKGFGNVVHGWGGELGSRQKATATAADDDDAAEEVDPKVRCSLAFPLERLQIFPQQQ